MIVSDPCDQQPGELSKEVHRETAAQTASRDLFAVRVVRPARLAFLAPIETKRIYMTTISRRIGYRSRLPVTLEGIRP